MKKDTKAFTLAEVLITLGIIGVVAAISIPTLMQNTNRKDTVSKVKKGFNTFSNAFSLAVATNGNIDKWGLSGTSTKEDAILIAEKVKPYLNIIKDCEVDKTGCIYSGMYKSLNNNDLGNYQSSTSYYKLLLHDGTAIAFKDGGNDRQDVWAYFDINGEKGPNKLGIDLFVFEVEKEGKILPIKERPNMLYQACNKSANGAACSSYILENSNMDYLDE